jgi:hypothetical protein
LEWLNDDDASLQGDEPDQDSEDECNDTHEVSPNICLFVNLLLTAAVSSVNITDRLSYPSQQPILYGLLNFSTKISIVSNFFYVHHGEN